MFQNRDVSFQDWDPLDTVYVLYSKESQQALSLIRIKMKYCTSSRDTIMFSFDIYRNILAMTLQRKPLMKMAVLLNENSMEYWKLE